MTTTSERIYYTDAYCTTFTARITDLSVVNGRPTVALDQTCFYPTSGGQAHDTGVLGERRVVDVFVDEAGTVRHVLDAPLPAAAVGRPIQGEIDWERRYDHMQQHAGQHLLSQVFHRLLGVETLSVHFGAQSSTVDLDVESLSDEQMMAVEDEANRQVYANRSIRAYFVSQDELASVPLRRPPKVRGRIRIVEIEGYDYSACGGTHVARTGEIGPVRLVRRERSRGHARVTFLCGWRALADAREKARLVNEIAALFSTDPAQTPVLAARNLDQLKVADRRIQELSAQLLAYEAERLWADASDLGGWRVIARLLPGQDPAGLKLLANLLQAKPATVALLACPAGGDKLTVIFARSADVDAAMGDLLRTTLRAFGGGGGGRSEYAQGGGVPADQAEALLDFAVEKLGEV